jgi:hypothetical protein
MASQAANQRRSIRSSVFSQERRDVAVAQRQEFMVQAGVKQTIEFIAKFDNTAQQIANQVMQLSSQAMQDQMKDVMKILTPMMKEMEAARIRRMGTSG